MQNTDLTRMTESEPSLTGDNGALPCHQELDSPEIQTLLQQRSKMKSAERTGVWTLLPGWQWNPLLKLPANQKCPCKSGRKFKVCCRNSLPRAVKKGEAERYERQMQLPDLTFLTYQGLDDAELKKSVS